jgi:hypothetical protein
LRVFIRSFCGGLYGGLGERLKGRNFPQVALLLAKFAALDPDPASLALEAKAILTPPCIFH